MRGGVVRQVRDWVNQIADCFDLRPSTKTFKRWLKKQGYRWKRLRAQRNEMDFRFFQEEIAHLRALEANGEIDLCFMDESSFQLQPSIPYGWQRSGERYEMSSQKGGGFTVLGFWQRHQAFQAFLCEGAAHAELVKKCIEQWSKSLRKKTILILDQASVHTANLIKQAIPEWKTKQLYLQFIPARCPELNEIEHLWKAIKYRWIALEAYESKATLAKELDRVLNNIGPNKKYQITFG